MSIISALDVVEQICPFLESLSRRSQRSTVAEMHDEGEDEGKVHAAVTSSDFPDTVCFASPPPQIEIYVDLDRAFSVKA